jgi:glycosyltransferase A (GT-A) superfamily protein (DUF2064 family)
MVQPAPGDCAYHSNQAFVNARAVRLARPIRATDTICNPHRFAVTMNLRISLVVMAKWPEAGQSKTRLAQELGETQALAIARAMLADTVFRLGKANPAAFGLCTGPPQPKGQGFAPPGDSGQPSRLGDLQELPAASSSWCGREPVRLRRVLAYAPPQAATQFAELAGQDFVLLPQSKGDLGERLQTLLLSEWAAGQDAVIFLGTDSPTLPLGYIGTAIDWLRQVEVVLGPAWDGGYYLLGCRWSLRWLVTLFPSVQPHLPENRTLEPDMRQRLPALLGEQRLPIFTDIAWGSAQVFEQTVQRLETTRLRWALLPPWYDVDTSTDWAWLRAHLRALIQAGQECALPKLEAFS